ncbi:MAG: Hsp70 family protein [Bacillota bacterium]|nr:Hsp70 family protein [Bacillota bacterium]
MSIIGIDLGTTTCEIAYIKDGRPEIIPNEFGLKVTPSVVGVTDDGEYIAGEYAKRQLVLKPDKTVAEIKRLMGTDKTITIGNKSFLPEQISSLLLRKLKLMAEQYIGEEVTEAVITVPANFNTLQRSATKKAGELAGLKIERLINEPTAAAMAYGLDNIENDEKILVYDLGGGTFDVSVLELFSGILDVKASRGQNLLGGKDFDNRIIEYLTRDFYTNYDINLSNNINAMARIKEEAEKAKIQLTDREVAEINIPFLVIDNKGNPVGINTILTRNKFEELVQDLIQATNKSIDEALEAAGYIDDNIDVVLAVGGSSRMTAIKKLLVDRFGDKVKFDINPEEAVALGAAVQAAIKEDQISSEDGLIITDNCQYTLGISIVQTGEYGRLYHGVFDPLIKRDSKIPCKVKKRYYTLYDYQTEVGVEVYEGVSRIVKDNTFIGKVLVKDIPRGLGGSQAVDVTFTYNLNGILEVEGETSSSGKKVKALFDLKEYQNEFVTVQDILMVENGGLEAWKKGELAPEVKLTIELGEKKLQDLDDDKKIEVGLILNKLKQAVIDNKKELVEKLDKDLTDILFEI